MSDNAAAQKRPKDSLKKKLKANSYLLSLFCFGSAASMKLMAENQYVYRRVESLYEAEVTSSENSTGDNSTGGTCGGAVNFGNSSSSGGGDDVRFQSVCLVCLSVVVYKIFFLLNFCVPP